MKMKDEHFTEEMRSTEKKHSMEQVHSRTETHSSEKLLSAIGEIDDNLVSEAFSHRRNRKIWLKWGSLAAILVLCICTGIVIIGISVNSKRNPDIPDADSSNADIYFADTDAQDADTANGMAGADALNADSRNLGIGDSYLAANSLVILDVNPSIALTVNADERIVNAEGLNEDGWTILNGMDLTDVDITVAVNAVIGSMLQKGYLSDLQNAILVTVENEDSEKSAALQERISSIIGTALQDGNLEGTVLSQTLNDTSAPEELALNYGISPGKAALIQEVMSQDPTLTIENLVPLSITEIALISQSKSLSSQSLAQSGAASDKAYISQDSALEIAYGHAGINDGDVTRVKAEFDSEDGVMVYEIEFCAGTTEYEYDINARTGQVMKYEAENKGAAKTEGITGQQPATSQPAAGSQQPGDTAAGSQQPEDTIAPSGSQQSGNQYIGEEAAKEQALANAGISADTVKYINVWLEYDNGRPECYEVEFTVGSTEYKYEIDLYSGAVLAQKTENHGSHEHGNGIENNDSPSSVTDIGEEAAKAAALSHAGLSASQVRKLKVHQEYDDGFAVYEIEFEYNGYEYEYKIDAAAGTILEYEIDD